MNIIYQSNGLSPFQKGHRELSKVPQGCFCEWAVEKIEFFEEKENAIVDMALARTAKRIIALAMPIFALLEIVRSVGRCLINLCRLRPEDALYELSKCKDLLKIFAFSVLTLPLSVVFPTLVYRSERRWSGVKRDQIEKMIRHEFSKETGFHHDRKTAYTKALKGVIGSLICDADARRQIERIVYEFVPLISWNTEDEEPVRDAYTDLLVQVLVKAEGDKIPIDELDVPFHKLCKQILALKRPLLRTSLLVNALDTFHRRRPVFSAWSKAVENSGLKDESQIALFQIFQIEGSDHAVKMLKNNLFRDRPKVLKFLTIIHKLLTNCQLCDVLRRGLHNLLVKAYQMDIASQRAFQRSVAKRKQRKRGVNLHKLEQTRERIAQQVQHLKSKKSPNQQEKKALEKQKKRIQKLDEKIRNARETKSEPVEGQPSQNDNHAPNERYIPGIHISKAMENLDMILSLKNTEIIRACLEMIGDGKRFASLSDSAIIDVIFYKEFRIEGFPENLGERLAGVRRPDIFITFHSRLKELNGKDRKEALRAYHRYIVAAFNGRLLEERHNTENNPHLKKIFSEFPEIKNKWLTLPKTTMGQFYQGKEVEGLKRFERYTVVDSNDAEDLILQSAEIPNANSCLNINGRLTKVHGMLGLFVDGKTHSLFIKDHKGRIVAKTRLVLLWDQKNQHPVLLLDQVDARPSPGDLLYKTLWAMSQKRAEEMGLALVTVFGKNGKHSYRGKKYEGQVVSLGSSSPIEYVNTLIANRRSYYRLGALYRV